MLTIRKVFFARREKKIFAKGPSKGLADKFGME